MWARIIISPGAKTESCRPLVQRARFVRGNGGGALWAVLGGREQIRRRSHASICSRIAPGKCAGRHVCRREDKEGVKGRGRGVMGLRRLACRGPGRARGLRCDARNTSRLPFTKPLLRGSYAKRTRRCGVRASARGKKGEDFPRISRESA